MSNDSESTIPMMGSNDDLLTKSAVLLLKIAHPMVRMINSEVSSAGEGSITSPQFCTLALISQGYRLPSALARYMRISPAAASETVELLVRRDLITRSDQPGDRRCTQLSLTEEGTRQYNVAVERALSLIMQFISSLGPGELEKLSEGLEALSALMTKQSLDL